MLLILMGQNCCGKTTITKKLQETYEIEAYSGKDYVRLAKNEYNAWDCFEEKLKAAHEDDNKILLYEVADPELLTKIEDIQGTRIKVTANIEKIKERFAERIGRELPVPLVKFIEHKYAEWEEVNCDHTIDTTQNEVDAYFEKVKEILKK